MSGAAMEVLDSGPADLVEPLVRAKLGPVLAGRYAADIDLVGAHGRRKRRLFEPAVHDVRRDVPLNTRDIQHDDRAARRLELTRGFEQQVLEEAFPVRLRRELLQIGADRGVRVRKFRNSGLRRLFALAPHGLHEALAVQRGADESGCDLER